MWCNRTDVAPEAFQNGWRLGHWRTLRGCRLRVMGVDPRICKCFLRCRMLLAWSPAVTRDSPRRSSNCTWPIAQSRLPLVLAWDPNCGPPGPRRTGPERDGLKFSTEG